ncbi:MAG: hypothetical protein HY744_27880 [Deltaproteobacteria bacterium]|nr:hypothetical protein [Deltaproteobacteria bacterium]
MAARVPLLVTAPSGASLRCAAILNGGFESEEPAVLLPGSAAVQLYSSYPRGTGSASGDAATGEVELRILPWPVSACLSVPARTCPLVACTAAVSDGATEVLLSDSAIDALGLRVESFRLGCWRFADESLVRASEPPQIWPRRRPRRRRPGKRR